MAVMIGLICELSTPLDLGWSLLRQNDRVGIREQPRGLDLRIVVFDAGQRIAVALSDAGEALTGFDRHGLLRTVVCGLSQGVGPGFRRRCVPRGLGGSTARRRGGRSRAGRPHQHFVSPLSLKRQLSLQRAQSRARLRHRLPPRFSLQGGAACVVRSRLVAGAN